MPKLAVASGIPITNVATIRNRANSLGTARKAEASRQAVISRSHDRHAPPGLRDLPKAAASSKATRRRFHFGAACGLAG